MKILSRIGGVFLLLVLAIAAILGFQTETGRPIWTGISQAATDVVNWVRQEIQLLTRTPIPGHAAVAIAIAAVGVIAVLGLLKKPISVRAFTVLVLVAAIAAYILYNPTVVATA